MKLRLHQRWRLFIHNWVKFPYRQMFVFRPRWIAAGNDPAAMPRFARGRLTLADMDWAATAAKKTNDRRVPYSDFRARVVEARRVAQPGSASALGAEGRRFKSDHADHDGSGK
jgi:hypothetical protein